MPNGHDEIDCPGLVEQAQFYVKEVERHRKKIEELEKEIRRLKFENGVLTNHLKQKVLKEGGKRP